MEILNEEMINLKFRSVKKHLLKLAKNLVSTMDNQINRKRQLVYFEDSSMIVQEASLSLTSIERIIVKCNKKYVLSLECLFL